MSYAHIKRSLIERVERVKAQLTTMYEKRLNVYAMKYLTVHSNDIDEYWIDRKGETDVDYYRTGTVGKDL